MPTRLQSTLTRLQNAGARILHIVTNVTGRTPEVATIVLLVVLGYIVLLIILIPIHRSLLRRLKRRTERLTWEYDSVRYLLAKAQQEAGVGGEYKGIKILFDFPHPDYFHHTTEIKQEIQKIETSLGKPIIDQATRANIDKRYKKRKSLKTVTSIYGRCISVITVLVYKLFW